MWGEGYFKGSCDLEELDASDIVDDKEFLREIFDELQDEILIEELEKRGYTIELVNPNDPNQIKLGI